MTVTAAMVKELRERTGAGMMECKKALSEVSGSMDAAVEILRKKGAAAADKKSSRIAAEGIVVIKHADNARTAVILEVNSETDFVAKDRSFLDFTDQVANVILTQSPVDLEALSCLALSDGVSVEHARRNLIAKIGENISVRRFTLVSGAADEVTASYLHASRIGVIVCGLLDAAVGRDVAMHIAATKPVSLSMDDLPADLVDKEKEIFKAQAQASGKPPQIIEKMTAGRIQKFINDNTLLGQPFVKNPDQTVEQFLAHNKASISSMVRFEVGEGVEKKQDDFAAEVMAAVKGA